MAHPTFDSSAAQSDWSHVLWFSATLLTLAVALPVFGRMVGGRWVVRIALLAGAGVALASIANVFEDGFHIDWVFFVFVLGTLIMNIALLALTVAIAITGQGGRRLLALIPAGTMAAILLFVLAGGVIMLVTWLVAAAASIALSGCTGPSRPRPLPTDRTSQSTIEAGTCRRSSRNSAGSRSPPS